jgi:Na+/proline symporter
MSAHWILLVLLLYFGVLMLIGYLTGKQADSYDFFVARRQSPWYVVAFGMIGASLSGVTFVSVPGWVGTSAFSYFQMVLGYLLGYAVIAFVLLPLYYRLNLVSIYSYLQERIGERAYKTGAAFFLLSRTIGAAFRLYLVALVLHVGIFRQWGLSFGLTTLVSLLLIWLYTARGGIKTIVWTDTLQTTFMLLAVVFTIWFIKEDLGWSWTELSERLSKDTRSQVFFWDDWKDGKFFWKQFIAGAFIAIVMTGLDQDMMQKNLSCRTLRDAQKNMITFSWVLLPVNWLFLTLGLLLYVYAETHGLPVPAKSDMLYPTLAFNHFHWTAALFFLLGITAAAYSSADSALTALTTSFCIDILDFEKIKDKDKQERLRRRVHIGITALLWLVIMVFHRLNDESVISAIFKAAGYTYGPLLGMYAFGLLTRRHTNDKLVPWIAIATPFITWGIAENSERWFNGYQFGYELLLLNGLLCFVGLWMASRRAAV